MIIRTALLRSLVIALPFSDSVRADDYLAPSGGFDYQYIATLYGELPENSDPAWTNTDYTSQTAVLGTGGVTGEPALILTHNSTNGFAYYSLDTPGGSGTNTDLITLDFRFRLRSASTVPQLSFAIVRPPTSFQSYGGAATEDIYNFRFAKNVVTTVRDGVYTNSSYNFANTWHNARLTVDVGMGRSKLYVDGSTTPLVAWNGSKSTAAARNMLTFGDGESAISGGAEISYLKWSNDVLAVPMSGSAQGQRLEITEHRALYTNSDPDEHYFFPYVKRFDDGSMWMSYFTGKHLVQGFPEDEHHVISTDNGATWSTTSGLSPINSHQFAPGTGPLNGQGEEMRILSASMWSSTPGTNHTLYINRWVDSTGPRELLPGGSGRTVTFPFSTTAYAHRSMIELDNGDLLQTIYGTATGDSKPRSMLLRSTNKGNSWSYLSTMASSNDATEGMVEPTITQLQDGSLLALMRTGFDVTDHIWQTRSLDGGVTWIDGHSITQAFGAVDPCVITLTNGALVATSGRPGGVFMLVDYTGTGNDWQEVEILSSDRSTSGYTSLVEYEPNKVKLFYDWTGFHLWNMPAAELPNRLMVTSITIDNELPLSGDYNKNGIADAADYVIWRKQFGQNGQHLAADGTGPGGTPDGTVDGLDYDFWRTHFGNPPGAGSPSGAGATPLQSQVPEPTGLLIGCSAALSLLLPRSARRQRGNARSNDC